jgi:competence ComEA-like helix-hairpin-helix protein
MLSGRDVFAGERQSNRGGDKVSSFAFVIAGGVCFLLSVCFIISGRTGTKYSYELKLDEKINPNEASAASLARLPGIGIVKAEAIAAYRENFKKETGNCCAFRNCDDLQKVKGIGAKTTQEMSRWLKFE